MTDLANRSFEFFAWPGYVNNVTATSTCLENLKDLSGVWPPIRIGGTTQYGFQLVDELFVWLNANQRPSDL